MHILKPKQKIHWLYFLIDLILIAFSFYFPYFIRYNLRDDLFANDFYLPNLREYTFTCIIWVVFLVVAFKRRGLYVTDRSLTIPREAVRVIVGVIYTGVLVGAMIFFAQYKFFSREIFVNNILLLMVLLSSWRILKRIMLRRLISQGYHNVNVLIVGAGNVGKIVLSEIKRNPWWGFKIVGFLDDNKQNSVEAIPVLGALNEFAVLAKRHFVEEVIITIPSELKIVSEIIKQARQLRLGIRVVPVNFEESLPVLHMSHLGIVPLLTYKERMRHPADLAVKRLFDFFGSLVLLIMFSPVFLFIALAIKANSRGPVFYVQKRSGLKGKIFKFFKFRSMVINAEQQKESLIAQNEVKDGVIFKMRNDPRVTRVGRWLRKYSFDELPQLFNVLLGDMSLVGPRPPTPDEVVKYSHIHMQRLSIRPGITGLSQVRGRSELTFYRWVKWDLWYINNWSIWLDLRILVWTIPAIIRARGAY